MSVYHIEDKYSLLHNNLFNNQIKEFNHHLSI